MTSSFFGLQIGLSALRAHQRSMETITHNIANVNTEGYSRQEVSLASRWLPIEQRSGGGFLGAGVDVVDVRRYASRFLTEQIRRESGEKARWEVLSDALSQVQVIFNEPSEEGLGAALDRFWGGWKDLGTDPTNFALRARLREIAEELASLIRQKYQELLALREELNRRIRDAVRQVNDLAAHIANVDRQIRQGTGIAGAPNDLLDERDRLLTELGRVIRISVSTREDGSVTVSVGGHLLISKQGAHEIAEGADLVWAEDGAPVRVLGGELAGLLEARDVEVPSYIDRLNELTHALITGVNSVHRNGYGLNNATGLDFFSGTDASDVAVAAPILEDLDNIAAASAPEAPGDGSQALEIAALADQPLLSEGATPGTFYSTMVALIGIGVRQADAVTRNQSVLLRHLEERREAISGVSLDEETVKLVASQRAYEAAARVITAMDEMLDRLINSTGVVGR
ncbi:MAG TPA: flagellar hook-associated protein FlgK [Caldilineae bacterium]|nr:flagellar hook-associated protein FlgK [Caldilineae bacterium]